MSLHIRLLGRPALVRDGEPAYRFRSQKSWALLAYLLLAERPPSRSRLAELLFDETEDPLGALRWNLAEVRRGLGPDAVLEHGVGPQPAAHLGQVPAQRAERVLGLVEEQLGQPAARRRSLGEQQVGQQRPALLAAEAVRRLAVPHEGGAAEEADVEAHRCAG